MRIAAGLVGILVGIFSVINVGLFGGMLGSATSWLGSGPWAHGDSSVSNLGQLISLLSYLSGLLAIVGGIVAFSNTRIGGIILAGSAFSHWYLLGFGVIGKAFILPIAAAAAFAFFAAPSKLKREPSGWATSSSVQNSGGIRSEGASFDRAKWNALVQYDKDIAIIAERLQPLGQKWIDEFASSYLALNDKQYLPDIEQKIVAGAKAEAADDEQRRIRAEEGRKAEEEQRKVYEQEQERLKERRAEARRKRFELWRDRIWGTRQGKLRTTIVSTIFIIVIVAVAFWPKPPLFPRDLKLSYLPISSSCQTGCYVQLDINESEKLFARLILEQLQPCTLAPNGGNFFLVVLGDKFGDVNLQSLTLDSSPSITLKPYSHADAKSWYWEAPRPFLDKMKTAKSIVVEATNSKGQIGEFVFPMSEFGAAYAKWKPDAVSLSVSKAVETEKDGRFIVYNNGTVRDTITNLMWAAKDNGSNVIWENAKFYCENYRGGGYTEWRLPTAGELMGLYDVSKSRPGACKPSNNIHVITKFIDITCFALWASETRGSEAGSFDFGDGIGGWESQSNAVARALPVRSGK